jgi:uncharacterized protein YecE (DUF72 family)
MAGLYIGTSGYTYPAWRNLFYPKGLAQKNWLNFYAQHFNAVEINATFYRPFPPHVFTNWREATPPEFRFVLKAPKVITHEKALQDIHDELQSFLSSIQGLNEKLALVLWQFPAGLRANEAKERFLQLLPALPQSIRQVFEFRHPSWFTNEVFTQLNQHKAGFVINDSPLIASHHVITGSFMYVRFHGPEKLYDSAYSHAQLATWAEHVRPHVFNEDVFLFFNNTSTGQAISNAREMRELLTP